MLTAQVAEKLILDLVRPLSSQDREIVSLTAASGRILAAPVTSSLDFPHWDNSAMDGYAVRYVDVQECQPDRPVSLQIVEEIPAGVQPQRSLSAGQAARIFTGAMLPVGADTVVMQEETQRQGDRVTLLTAPTPQAFVRHQGAYYQAGNPLLSTGIMLSAPEIAVLAAAQCLQVPVYRRPQVVLLSTGNELVTPEDPLKPGQIVDSNQYALATLVSQTGAEPISMGIIPDEPEALKAAIAHALSIADLVISTGGVSVGDYDYVDRLLVELDGQIHIRSVAVKPGKPLTVALFGRQRAAEIKAEAEKAKGEKANEHFLPAVLPPADLMYFGLPGNPASALVTFWRFVQPALRKLMGLPASAWGPTWVKGRSPVALRSDGKRETYLWGQLHLVQGEYEFRPAGGGHVSGNLINLVQTNALAMIPLGQTQVEPHAPVLVLLVSPAILG
jgi:molybdopterin molybdotransferase